MSVYKKKSKPLFDPSLIRDKTNTGLDALGLELSAEQLDKLVAYLALFHKWNKAYNLSAVRDPLDMVVLHLLDSLSVAPYLQGSVLIDVGTGGGLPGLPLAIVYPMRQWTLLDSAGKKTRFLHQVVTELGLDNVTVQNCRVEQYCPADLFDGVISRAFASLEDMTSQCRHLLNNNGRFWAMKGRIPDEELRQIEKNYNVEHCHSLRVPSLDAERCLVVIRPKS